MIGYKSTADSTKKKHRLQTFLALCLSLVLLLCTILIGGCGGGADTVIRGWVSAEGPVSGGKLTSYDTNGKQVYKTGEPATGEFGSFVIMVKKLPADFRVVASGVPAEIEYVEPRNEVQHAHASHEKLARTFGFRPQVELREGIERMAAWARRHGKRRSKRFGEIEIPKNLPAVWRT